VVQIGVDNGDRASGYRPAMQVKRNPVQSIERLKVPAVRFGKLAEDRQGPLVGRACVETRWSGGAVGSPGSVVGASLALVPDHVDRSADNSDEDEDRHDDPRSNMEVLAIPGRGGEQRGGGEHLVVHGAFLLGGSVGVRP
jgi:hypothetical protein